MQAKVNEKIYDIELVEKDGNKVLISLNGELVDVDAVLSENGFCSILYGGRSYNAECVNPEEGKYVITTNFRRFEIELGNPRKRYMRTSAQEDDVQDCIKAPMPGKIVKVFVEPGQEVRKGDALLIIEAMKMQSTYTALQDSIVEKVNVGAGDSVLSDHVLITFKHYNE